MVQTKDFKVGETAYLAIRKGGNAARGLTPEELNILKPVTVTKVGPKYVTVSNGYAFIKFESHCHHSDNYQNCLIEHTNCCADYLLYRNPEDFKSDFLRGELLEELKSRFSELSFLPLDCLLQIKQVFDFYPRQNTPISKRAK